MRTFLMFCVVLSTTAQADPFEATRVLPQGELPKDSRLAPLKDLNGYFPFFVPDSLDEWKQRATELKRRILVANGLWPLPARQPVQPTIHGRVDRDDYSVEKVYFESYPGFYVTGNLYRPKLKQGPYPAVVSPHGHWANGRFYDAGEEAVREEIANGAEHWEREGRYPLQSRCVQLARMGCIVFHYDMVGYADSTQISYEVAHRHAEVRPAMEGHDQWGLYSAQAELRLQSVMGLQTLNSMRAVDFVASLPDVDKTRIAATGASGGGTQTMILAALDPRITLSFPAVMVSTAMQGGCTCENASCLRVGTGNVEFAALFAPGPQGINAANDWTVELKDKGLPELKQLYEMYGAKDRIEGYPLTHFPHNYNSVSRVKMYNWINKHFQMGQRSPVIESRFEPLSVAEMSVWNDEHPQPPGGEDFEKELLGKIASMSDEQLAAILPTKQGDMAEFREVVGGALETILATSYDTAGKLTRENLSKEEHDSYWMFRDLFRDKTNETEMPAIFLHPKNWNGDVVIWVAGQGKASLMDAGGGPRSEAQSLLDAGFSIASADLFLQGEFLADQKPLVETRKVENPRDFAGYSFGYNRTQLAEQVHDLVSWIKYIVNDDHNKQQIHLLGVEGATPQAVLARCLVADKIASLAIDDGDFRFATIASWRDPFFLPGAVKYGDLPVMLALNAPHATWMASSDGNVPQQTKQVFKALGGDANAVDSSTPVQAAIDWLIEKK